MGVASSRAVPILTPQLKDEEVKLIVPWSLEEIGDTSAISALIEALGNNNVEMRAAGSRGIPKRSWTQACLSLVHSVKKAKTTTTSRRRYW
jgi:hypothetical protein